MLRLHAEFFLFGGSFQLLLFELTSHLYGKKMNTSEKTQSRFGKLL